MAIDIIAIALFALLIFCVYKDKALTINININHKYDTLPPVTQLTDDELKDIPTYDGIVEALNTFMEGGSVDGKN